MSLGIDDNLPLTGRGSSKWAGAADPGFVIVPDALLAKQADLGIGATELVVLLHILSFWWAADRPAFPPTSVIAKRMKVQTRTVQRAIKQLQKMGLIEKELRPGRDGRALRVLTFDGLIARLNRHIDADPVLKRRASTRRPPFLEVKTKELSA